jgi:hypothetical protein
MEKKDTRGLGHVGSGRGGIQSGALKGAIPGNGALVLEQGSAQKPVRHECIENYSLYDIPCATNGPRTSTCPVSICR